jgi:ATP-binding cassette subfamily F protein uup
VQKRRSDSLQSTPAVRESLSKPEQKTPPKEIKETKPEVKTRKLSYKEQRELETLPEKIAALETEQASITSALADGTLFATDSARALQLTQRNTEIDDELLAALERWEVLGG